MHTVTVAFTPGNSKVKIYYSLFSHRIAFFRKPLCSSTLISEILKKIMYFYIMMIMSNTSGTERLIKGHVCGPSGQLIISRHHSDNNTISVPTISSNI